jgi:hypothetical protein
MTVGKGRAALKRDRREVRLVVLIPLFCDKAAEASEAVSHPQ